MSYEMIAILMFSSMMLMLLTGQRVFGAIGFVAVVAALALWAYRLKRLGLVGPGRRIADDPGMYRVEADRRELDGHRFDHAPNGAVDHRDRGPALLWQKVHLIRYRHHVMKEQPRSFE